MFSNSAETIVDHSMDHGFEPNTVSPVSFMNAGRFFPSLISSHSSKKLELTGVEFVGGLEAHHQGQPRVVQEVPGHEDEAHGGWGGVRVAAANVTLPRPPVRVPGMYLLTVAAGAVAAWGKHSAAPPLSGRLRLLCLCGERSKLWILAPMGSRRRPAPPSRFFGALDWIASGMEWNGMVGRLVVRPRRHTIMLKHLVFLLEHIA